MPCDGPQASQALPKVQEPDKFLCVSRRHRDLVTGLSYLTGRTLTADNLRTAAANLGINRAELLTRYRLADLEEVTALAECIGSLAVTRLPCNLPRPSGLCSATLSQHGAGLID